MTLGAKGKCWNIWQGRRGNNCRGSEKGKKESAEGQNRQKIVSLEMKMKETLMEGRKEVLGEINGVRE